MNAKTYLSQYGNIKARLRAIEVMIREIREELTSIESVSLRSAWPDGQPHGTGTTDPTGTQAVKAAVSEIEAHRDKLKGQLQDLEIMELKEQAHLWSKRARIENTLGLVSDQTHYEVLHRRYIEGKKFEVIAVEMSYSFRHTIRLHGEALREVDKILKKTGKK
ncbi:hypothetical protein IJI72_00615 [Candidatus Saccharibacteria bacterium]|nr:hypothetical protein [Candidatus Saccharibacteria bacterium]